MIIALLTDFGTQDYFVGAMKGVILSINENAQIVDITHDIEPQNIKSAGFNLFSVYKNFPSKTIFVTVVDPGVGSNRKAILVETENHFFISPDNGLLSLVLNENENYKVFEISNEKFFKHPISKTFHGRDIFAPVAAWLSKGIKPSEFGNEINNFTVNQINTIITLAEDEIQGEIIHIDHFGNIITNISKSEKNEKPILKINNNLIEKHYVYYAEAGNSELFSIWGSASFLEIVAFKDSARNILNAEIGDKITLKFE